MNAYRRNAYQRNAYQQGIVIRPQRVTIAVSFGLALSIVFSINGPHACLADDTRSTASKSSRVTAPVRGLVGNASSPDVSVEGASTDSSPDSHPGEDVREADAENDLDEFDDELDSLLEQDLGSLRRTSVAPSLDVEVSSVSRQKSTIGRSPAAIPAYVAFDARFGWNVGRHLSASVVGRNLFDPRHPEFGSNDFTCDVPTEVPRSLHAYLEWRR